MAAEAFVVVASVAVVEVFVAAEVSRWWRRPAWRRRAVAGKRCES
jgi:hypothetical protein